jgi:hypothetical protein
MRVVRRTVFVRLAQESSTGANVGIGQNRFDCSVGIKGGQSGEIEADVVNYYQFICAEKSFAEAEIYYIDTTIRNIKCMSLA